MALDEPKNTDSVYDIEGFKYIVDKNFMEKIKPVKVDFMYPMGFKISSSVQFGGGCGGSCSSHDSESCSTHSHEGCCGS